jgi:hypothetical protein
MVIVTDAIPATGLPVGIHHFGPQAVEIKGNRAVIASTDTLCGRLVIWEVLDLFCTSALFHSIATLNQCIQHFLEATGDSFFLLSCQ